MADFFGFFPQPSDNLLPYDGTVNDYGIVFPTAQADVYLRTLLAEIDWRHDEAVVFGQRRTTARQVAWYAANVRLPTPIRHPPHRTFMAAAAARHQTNGRTGSPPSAHTIQLLPAQPLCRRHTRHGVAQRRRKRAGTGSAIASLSSAPPANSPSNTNARRKREMLLQHGQLDCDARQRPAPLAARSDEKHQSARAEGEFDVSGDGE